MAGTLNDAIRAAVGGQNLNDGLLAYYRASTGVPGGTLSDQERGHLIIANILTPASAAGFTNNDLWMRLPLGNGTLNDRQMVYWLAATGFGPELVRPGGAISGTWQVNGATITRNGSATGQAVMNEIVGTTGGVTYRVQFTVSNLSGDTFYVSCGNSAPTQVTANGNYSFNLVAAELASVFKVAPWAGSPGQATITNMSVRRVL